MAEMLLFQWVLVPMVILGIALAILIPWMLAILMVNGIKNGDAPDATWFALPLCIVVCLMEAVFFADWLTR